MRRELFVCMVMTGILILSSCKNEVRSVDENNKVSENSIIQAADGTISLKINSAECYSDMSNPSNNTAEWSVVVSKSGRYNVWLSSATKDTNDLHYGNSVMLSIRDKRLEARPACDKIVLDSDEVSYPYFRADSFIGSLYIQDTGRCNIQVISDKIIPVDYKGDATSSAISSKLLSVFLTPEIR
jgi:hypothetical protein